jgi:hypothetical protein
MGIRQNANDFFLDAPHVIIVIVFRPSCKDFR